MKIINFNILRAQNNQQIRTNKNVTGLKLRNQLSRDTVSFGRRIYNNTDPNTQLYRGVGASEIRALCKGKTIEGPAFATSNPRGYFGGYHWSIYGGFGDYFITFKKRKIKFQDRRNSEKDTRYLVKSYNIADVESIRKGQNGHGELIYSTNFGIDKQNDILAKQKDIKDTLIKLRKIKLTKKEKEICIDNLKSYLQEFPKLEKAINIANQPLRFILLRIKEKYLTSSKMVVENKSTPTLLKSMTPQKVQEFGRIRDKKAKCRLLSIKIASPSGEFFNSRFSGRTKSKVIKELKSNIEKVKSRLKTLMEMENKNNVVNLEIKSLNQVLEKFKKLKI